MEIYVDEFALTPKRFIAGTKGSYGFCTMCFHFGAEWDGLAKKVTFYPLDGSDPVYLIVSDDKVEIPQEIMRCAGVNRYVVSGCKNEDVLISITGEIDVLDSLSPDGVNAEDPTPTQMEQVMTMMQRAVDVAQSVRNDADEGAFSGEKGEQGEKGEKGEKGDRGEKGDKGDAGEVSFAYANQAFANSLRGTVSGETIAVTDISPIQHEMNVRVRSKNLCPESALSLKANGGTMSKLGSVDYDETERKITLTADANDNSAGIYGLPFSPEAEKYYTFSCEIKGTSGKKVQLGWLQSKKIIALTSEYQKVAYSMLGSQIQGTSGICLYSAKTSDGGLALGEYLQFRNIQIEEGTIATDYAPRIDVCNIQMGVCGKNVFFSAADRKEDKGIIAQKMKDGTFRVYGTSDGTGDFLMDMVINLPGGRYTGSGCPKGGSSTTWFIEYRNQDTGEVKMDYGDGVEFEASAAQMIVVRIGVRNGQTVDLIFKPMIELGTGDKVYEPLIPPVLYTLDSNGEMIVKSIYPVTTLISNTVGVIIDCAYNRDLNKAFAELCNAIISTGGNV